MRARRCCCSWHGVISVYPNRYYLAGARFLVGLEGDETLLRTIDHALADPVWSLCLGRKAFPPSEPVRLPDGLREGVSLREALERYPIRVEKNRPSDLVRLVLESDGPTNAAVRVDQPRDYQRRLFGPRLVVTQFVERDKLLQEEVCISPC